MKEKKNIGGHNIKIQKKIVFLLIYFCMISNK